MSTNITGLIDRVFREYLEPNDDLTSYTAVADGSTVSYTVSADDVTRVDPSGWAFASSGFIQVISGSTEDTSSEIKVLLRSS